MTINIIIDVPTKINIDIEKISDPILSWIAEEHRCPYCNNFIYHKDDLDSKLCIPIKTNIGVYFLHKWCYDKLIKDNKENINNTKISF